MEENVILRKQLKLVSICVIAAAMIYLFKEMFEIYTGQSELEFIVETSGAASGIVRGIIICLIVIDILITLVYVFIEYKGIALSNGKKAGNAAYVLAIMFAVFNSISFISGLINYFKASDGLETTIKSLPMLAVVVIF